ncbi:MAG: Gfo/Idh/MocA family oxidoreductase, partial [Anaerolinea sp.]|nr:Gfo/Idh/MocA family oxidoreductase [Anaerolinea sp.]
MNVEPVGIGLVGAGAYGEFCLAAFAEMPEVRIAAVCDTDAARAGHFASRYNVPAYTDLAALIADPTVEIVALNTPPFLHAEQGVAALDAGKHLFC